MTSGVLPRWAFALRWNEESIMTAPDNQHCRVPLAEVSLKIRVKFKIIGIIQEEIQLDVPIAVALGQSTPDAGRSAHRNRTHKVYTLNNSSCIAANNKKHPAASVAPVRL
ncbi:hypothetical protein [Martelella alba]|uniref:Uncharacterized protein n=1 Tax=Martelella alba TaxID=2590451 RepID=A0ABY2SNS4_9HYPH|nr:hypothetical protein [Martelella alba]TKI07669.1 hypothetical protein FCN80_04275 [Martelella alba]